MSERGKFETQAPPGPSDPSCPVREIFLVRHGETGAQWRGRFVGASDVALSEAGRGQVAALARRLGKERIGRCLASPMVRTRETAEALAKAAGVAVELCEDLREIDFGDWEGLSFGEIAQRDPEAVARWAAFEPEFVFPGGEALAGFQERVRRAAEAIGKLDEERVLVVSHGGVIRAMLCHWLGLSAREYLIFDVQPASLTTVRLFGERGVLMGLNDRTHLERD